MIDRFKEITEMCVGDEQGGFREGRKCVDQIFCLRNVVEKYLEKNKEVFVAYMDLEKAYDRINREGVGLSESIWSRW